MSFSGEVKDSVIFPPFFIKKKRTKPILPPLPLRVNIEEASRLLYKATLSFLNAPHFLPSLGKSAAYGSASAI